MQSTTRATNGSPWGPIPRNAIATIKREVPIEAYASLHTTLQRSGLRLVGLCPIHAEKTPSFTIYDETKSFFCFGACSMGGDVIDLYRAIEGGSVRDAIYGLSERFDLQLRTDPDEWAKYSNEKERVRRHAERVKERVRLRRIFRTLILNDPVIQSITDPHERQAEIKAAYGEFAEGLKGVRL
jgi:DNA primase